MEIDADLLICLVQERQEIWDRTSSEYKNKSKIRESWREICRQMNPQFEELSDEDRKNDEQLVLKRWVNVRDQYIKFKNKEKQLQKPGAKAKKLRKYIYHDELQFLEKVRMHTETTGLEHGEETEESENEKVEQLLHPVKNKTPREKSKPTWPSATSSKSMQKQNRKFSELITSKLAKTHDPEQDRNLMFFKSLLPSLVNFNESQILDFQMGVLQLIKDTQRQQILDEPYYSPQPSELGKTSEPMYIEANPSALQTSQSNQYSDESSDEANVYSPSSDVTL